MYFPHNGHFSVRLEHILKCSSNISKLIYASQYWQYLGSFGHLWASSCHFSKVTLQYCHLTDAWTSSRCYSSCFLCTYAPHVHVKKSKGHSWLSFSTILIFSPHAHLKIFRAQCSSCIIKDIAGINSPQFAQNFVSSATSAILKLNHSQILKVPLFWLKIHFI